MIAWTAPFAVAEGGGGGLVHRVVGVGTYPGGRPGLTLSCGATIGLNATPVERPDEADATCARCDIEGLQRSPEVVYLALTPRGLKVGHTKRLMARMVELDGDLLHQAPGTARAERSLLVTVTAIAAPVRGREWFPATPEVEAAARAWFDSRLAVPA